MSVLVPVRDAEPAAVAATVASLVAQSEPSWEAVLVEKFEGTKGRRPSFPGAAGRLVPRASPADGLSELAARGLAAATGEWV
ncbi:MAG TPA: hypothetical protein VGN54_01795, partial [Mycobacteriales bacterium]|nr:hypothetical protein [Mycobacteriales bacterium]